MRPRRVPLSAIPLVLSLLVTQARADQGTIVRVRSSSSALDERLSAELSTLGFEVREVPSNDATADLGRVARANGAAAAVRVNGDDAIELWVSPSQANETPIHETIQIDARRGWNVAAVSASEALRAHLLRFHQLSAPASLRVGVERAAAPPPRPTPPSKIPWLWVHVAGGAEASPGGLGPTAEILGELRFEPQAWLGVSTFGVFTPMSSQIEGPEGVASVRHAVAGAAVDAQGRIGLVRVSLGIGAALAMFTLIGRARAPSYGGQDASIVTLGPMLRSCASLDITRSLRLRAQLAGGMTTPRAVVRFAGREVADWGRPFGLLTLGFEWGIPN